MLSFICGLRFVWLLIWGFDVFCFVVLMRCDFDGSLFKLVNLCLVCLALF